MRPKVPALVGLRHLLRRRLQHRVGPEGRGAVRVEAGMEDLDPWGRVLNPKRV